MTSFPAGRPRLVMASGSPTVSREARESAPETPEAAANLQVFCKLCLSKQPSTATTGLQSCKCIYCTAVGTDDAFRFFQELLLIVSRSSFESVTQSACVKLYKYTYFISQSFPAGAENFRTVIQNQLFTIWAI